MKKSIISFITTAMLSVGGLFVAPNYVLAASQEIEGIGKYVIGEGDDITPEEAKKRALKLAKEDAAIKTPIFFEETAETKNGRLTKDETKVFSSIYVYFDNGNVKDEYKTEHLGNGRYQYSCRIVVTIDTDIVKDLINSRSKAELYQTKRQLKELEEEELKIEAKRRELAQKKKSLKTDEKKYLKAVTLENDKKEEALDLAKKSIASYLQKDYTKAIELSKKAIELDPNLSVPYRQLGQIYSDFGDYNEAMENFDKALKLNPKDAETYSSIGDYCKNMGNPKKSEESYKKALEINPHMISALNGMAGIYKDQGNFNKTKEYTDKVLSIDPNNIDAHFIIAEWTTWKGDFKKAIEILKKCDQGTDYDWRISRALSWTYDSLGVMVVNNNLEFMDLQNKSKKSQKDYIEKLENIVKRYPNHAVAWCNLGYAYNEDYERDKAKECIEKAIKLYPNYAYAYNKLGDINYKLKRYDEAIASYEKAYGISPKDVNVLMNMANVYNDTKKYREALKYANLCVELYPDYLEAWEILGEIYQNMGQEKEAAHCAEKATVIGPDWTFSWHTLGDIYLKQKQYEKAISAYEESIRLCPIFTSSYMRMGRLYSEKKDYENALIYYKKAVENANPRAKFVWSYIGVTYAKLNRLEEGEKYIYGGISKIPDSCLPWIGLSYMYEDAGLKEKQEECCIKAIKALPNEPYTHILLAVYYLKNDITKSIPPCKTALSLIENDKRKGYDQYTKNELKGMTFSILTFNNLVLGEFAEAELYAKKAIELGLIEQNPKAVKIFKALCVSLFMQNKYQEGAEVLEQAIKNNPDEKKFEWKFLYGFYIYFDKYDMGIDHLQKLSSKYPEVRELWMMLASFCHIQGRFNEAIEYYEKILALTFNDDNKKEILTLIEEAKNNDSSRISAEFEKIKQKYYSLYRSDSGGM